MIDFMTKKKRIEHPPTSWMQRFMGALTLMCGAPPPPDMCQEWIDNVQVNYADRLQAWVVNQPGTPYWVQGIVTIEAAEVWADSPEEGENHAPRPADIKKMKDQS